MVGEWLRVFGMLPGQAAAEEASDRSGKNSGQQEQITNQSRREQGDHQIAELLCRRE